MTGCRGVFHSMMEGHQTDYAKPAACILRVELDVYCFQLWRWNEWKRKYFPLAALRLSLLFYSFFTLWDPTDFYFLNPNKFRRSYKDKATIMLNWLGLVYVVRYNMLFGTTSSGTPGKPFNTTTACHALRTLLCFINFVSVMRCSRTGRHSNIVTEIYSLIALRNSLLLKKKKREKCSYHNHESKFQESTLHYLLFRSCTMMK